MREKHSTELPAMVRNYCGDLSKLLGMVLILALSIVLLWESAYSER